MNPTFVVKNHSRPTEAFDPEKLHRSILYACRSVHTPEGQAEDIAARVTVGILSWCQSKPEVTANDIRHQAAKLLAPLHSDAAYTYKNDKSMI